VSDPAPVEAQLAALQAQLDALAATNQQLAAEREQYRTLYLQTLELCRKLEQGLLGQKREKLAPGEQQLTLALLGQLLGEGRPAAAAPETTPVAGHERQKPTGRKPLPDKLPRIDVEVVPPEVQQQGLDAFERIGEDVTETVERRPAALVVVRTHRPKFVPKDRPRGPGCEVAQAPPPELPIARGLAGPGLLADTVVRRWQEHQPLHRLERTYGREGLELARATMCGWHMELAARAGPLVDAMWADAFQAPYLCTDATGVLVQAKEKCRHGHFWVVLAPERHALFAYTKHHDGQAVDSLLAGYRGYLVADAHSVYEHLFRTGDVVEVACWAHARRYFWKALGTDPERARHALALINELFHLERPLIQAAPDARLAMREAKARSVVAAFFTWVKEQAGQVLDETPIAKGLTYVTNQQAALERFLADGRLPLHNNWSERQLRREAVGRKNWLFVGTDEGGEVNATFVSLLASCELHGLEPWAYLRDLFCLLPSWPAHRLLDLAPAYWQQTLEQPDTQQRLAANVLRQVTLGQLEEHRDQK
jgi:transposase